MSYLDTYKVYVLALEGGKFYVGITRDLVRRYIEHKSHKGAAFTKRYKPVRIFYKRNTKQMYKIDAERIKQQVTIELMKKYGIDNVRGGDFCQIDTQSVIKSMRKKLYKSIIEANESQKCARLYPEIDKVLEGVKSGRIKVDWEGRITKVSEKVSNTTEKKNLPLDSNANEIHYKKSKNKKKSKKSKKISFWWEDYKPTQYNSISNT